MPLSDRKAGATNYPLNKILKIRFALVVCFISIFSLNNSDNLKGRAEAFFRVVNYEPSPSDCNSTKIEKKCDPCGNETGCCPDSEFCGVVAWCWSPTDGCYCCDDRIRHHFWITDIAAYNLAYLVYGPNTSPFMTACYTKPPASSFDAGHPGEWIDLCACNQDVSFSDYDSEFCD
jgi:hypothetical protein